MCNVYEKVVFYVNYVFCLDKIVYFLGNKNFCIRNKFK